MSCHRVSRAHPQASLPPTVCPYWEEVEEEEEEGGILAPITVTPPPHLFSVCPFWARCNDDTDSVITRMICKPFAVTELLWTIHKQRLKHYSRIIHTIYTFIFKKLSQYKVKSTKVQTIGELRMRGLGLYSRYPGPAR